MSAPDLLGPLQAELERHLAKDRALTAQGRLEANLADALARNRDLKTELAKLHRPRGTTTGTKCATCATWNGRELKRETWPCRTAVAAELDAS